MYRCKESHGALVFRASWINPLVLSPHVLFPHPPTTRFTTTSEQGRGCQSVRELVVGRVVANITLVSGADMSLVTGAGLGKVHV